jgi:hypothetical protein
MRNDWKVPDRKFHIGIAWSGSALNDINSHRSIDLKHFLDLCEVPGVQLYSLQKDAKRQDLYDTGASSVIRDLSGYISDVTDTLSIMKGLDLVIACESAVPHMAALADKECWVAVQQDGQGFPDRYRRHQGDLDAQGALLPTGRRPSVGAGIR